MSNDEASGQEKPQEAQKQKKTQKNAKKQNSGKWPLKIFFITLAVSFSFSLTSRLLLNAAGVIAAYLAVAVFTAISILFDIIAVAATACDVEPFLSMSARKVKGAKMAVTLAKNAAKVSSVCGDVVGDVCGIISGACTAAILASFSYTGFMEILAAVLIASALATITITGKAAGKTYAIRKANKIIFRTAKILSVFRKN